MHWMKVQCTFACKTYFFNGYSVIVFQCAICMRFTGKIHWLAMVQLMHIMITPIMYILSVYTTRYVTVSVIAKEHDVVRQVFDNCFICILVSNKVMFIECFCTIANSQGSS